MTAADLGVAPVPRTVPSSRSATAYASAVVRPTSERPCCPTFKIPLAAAIDVTAGPDPTATISSSMNSPAGTRIGSNNPTCCSSSPVQPASTKITAPHRMLKTPPASAR